MYKPKESYRWYPKVSFPLRLDDICLSATVKLLTKIGEKMAINSGRNCREKKNLREYLSKNLPASVQQGILERAAELLVGAQTSLNLLDMFVPDQVARQSVDLLGKFRFGFIHFSTYIPNIQITFTQVYILPFSSGFGCYLKEGRLTWSQGSAKKFNLTVEQCDQLYKILLWSKPAQLQELMVAIARDAMTVSKLPNILAQARSLTRLTLLSGAENHTLRIIGINCPHLKHLDVSHSARVTDQGLRNLLLKRPRSKILSRLENERMISENEDVIPETNACAEVLACITLLGTSVTWEGCDFACRVMNVGYLCSSLPIVKIVRLEKTASCERALPFHTTSSFFSKATSLTNQEKAVIASSIDNILIPEELEQAVVDHFRKEVEGNTTYVLLRHSNSLKLSLYMKMNFTQVTTLVLPWYTFTWRLDSLVELDILGMCFPNLKNFRGRVKGIWSHPETPLLPQLEVVHVWSLNSATGMSMLESVPSMQIFEFNNTATLRAEEGRRDLTDANLELALSRNLSLAQSITEISIRPAELTLKSMRFLVKKCPNLVRLGDLEAWRVTTTEIKEFNRFLDMESSPCLLTIMNFPPSNQATYNMTEIRGDT